MAEPLPIYDLDDEPDDFQRVHPLAAMHGVIRGLLHKLDQEARRPPSRAEQRQRRALDALRAALAAAIPHRHNATFMVPAVAELIRLMQRCARTETSGRRLATLVRLPEPWPWHRLSWSAPGLSLVAVAQLRGALEIVVVEGNATAQRAAQLRIVIGLENALREVMEALASHSASRAVANHRADRAFYEAEDAIGDDLADIVIEAVALHSAPRAFGAAEDALGDGLADAARQRSVH
jgi:hypothetical protein